MPMKNLIIASPINARITGPTEVEIDADDCVVRLTLPHADRRALHAICKTVNFAVRMKNANAQPSDRGDSGNPHGGEMT
jgi:hypothetical protein